MYRMLFPLAAAAALVLCASNPAPSRASWLSQALHERFDQDQPATYYDPVAPYYYTPAAPEVGVVPGYTYPATPGYVPYAYSPEWHGHWDHDHHWHDRYEHHEHHR